MTSPVSDPQQPADTAVQPEIPPAGPEFEVYTPPAFVPPQDITPAPAPVAPKPKRTGVVVLAVFTVLLFGAAGAFGALFFVEKKHSADLSTQIQSKDREITDLTKKAKDSKDDAARAAEGQKKAEADAAASQKCRDAAKEIRAALVSNDDAKGDAAVRSLLIEC